MGNNRDVGSSDRVVQGYKSYSISHWREPWKSVVVIDVGCWMDSPHDSGWFLKDEALYRFINFYLYSFKHMGCVWLLYLITRAHVYLQRSKHGITRSQIGLTYAFISVILNILCLPCPYHDHVSKLRSSRESAILDRKSVAHLPQLL